MDVMHTLDKTRLVVKKWANPAYILSPLLMRTISLENSNVSYQQYLDAEDYPVGDIKNYNVAANMRCVTSSEMSSPQGRIYQLNDARFITNYLNKCILLNKDDAFILESSNTLTAMSSFNWKHTRRKNSETLKVAMPFRGVSNNYYHTLIDNAPRLYALHNEEMSKLASIEVLCVEKLSVIEKHLFERLLPANAKLRLLDDASSYRIEKCIFPSFVTRQYSGYVPSGILEFFESKLMPDRPRKADKLIYISRKKAPVRRVINESELISKLQAAGFVEYCLEDLSFQEQIELFYDARMVVAPHGAGLTNVVFSKDVFVLEMFPNDFVKPSYYYLTRCVGGDYDFTNTADGGSIGRDFKVNIDLVMSKVEAWFNRPGD